MIFVKAGIPLSFSKIIFAIFGPLLPHTFYKQLVKNIWLTFSIHWMGTLPGETDILNTLKLSLHVQYNVPLRGNFHQIKLTDIWDRHLGCLPTSDDNIKLPRNSFGRNFKSIRMCLTTIDLYILDSKWHVTHSWSSPWLTTEINSRVMPKREV